MQQQQQQHGLPACAVLSAHASHKLYVISPSMLPAFTLCRDVTRLVTRMTQIPGESCVVSRAAGAYSCDVDVFSDMHASYCVHICDLCDCCNVCHTLTCDRSHLQLLCQLVLDGQLAVVLDQHRYVGLSAVQDAVDLLQSGTSSGKVVVQLSNTLPDAAAAAGTAKL